MHAKDILLYLSSIFWVTSNLTTLSWKVDESLPPPSLSAALDSAASSSYLRGGNNGEIRPASSTRTLQEESFTAKKKPTKKRLLVGIFTTDTAREAEYRGRHRALIELWNDERLCSLNDLIDSAKDNHYDENCEIVYTFVMGHGGASKVPPILVDDSRPILIESKEDKVEDEDDITYLNIRDNMNEGKSQTFLYYASKYVMSQHNIDYVMKCDSDSILYFHKLVGFLQSNRLPPSPYNTNVFVGALRDKSFWGTHNDIAPQEQHWHEQYQNVHLYLAGQNYMLSQDLATYVSQVEAKRILDSASSSTTDEENENGKQHQMTARYLEGHEDHDISSMAFHSSRPIQLIVISQSQRYWEHPVKGTKRWERIWDRETSRMNGVPFEGKLLKTKYTFE